MIDGCHLAFDVHRAQEWTTALDRWCEAQPDLVPFSGQCRAHRAELYVLHGAWSEALDAARSPQERCGAVIETRCSARTTSRAEVQRLRGDLDGGRGVLPAGQRVRASTRSPGLALLRLAQGETAVGADA